MRQAVNDGWRQTIAPLTDGGARLNYLVLLILLLIVLPGRGRDRQLQTYIGWVEVAEVFAISLPLFLALNLFFALFRVRMKERERGDWHGNRFVYNEPQLLLTALVDSSDNTRCLQLRVTDAEVGSIVCYVVEVDRADRRAKFQVVHDHGIPGTTMGGEIVHVPKGQFRLTESRTMKVLLSISPDATLTTVRIYMTMWELGPGDGRA